MRTLRAIGYSILLISLVGLLAIALLMSTVNTHAERATDLASFPTFVPDDECTSCGGNTNETTIVEVSYQEFVHGASAGFLQFVQIPYQKNMDVLDDYGYLFVDRERPIELTPDGSPYVRYYAISRLGTDARTNVGCFEAWYFNNGDPATTVGYGEAFCISDNDMLFLRDHGAKFWAFSNY
jgi:hypothetical protein